MFKNKLNNIIGLIDNLNEDSNKEYKNNIDYQTNNKKDDFTRSI